MTTPTIKMKKVYIRFNPLTYSENEIKLYRQKVSKVPGVDYDFLLPTQLTLRSFYIPKDLTRAELNSFGFSTKYVVNTIAAIGFVHYVQEFKRIFNNTKRIQFCHIHSNAWKNMVLTLSNQSAAFLGQLVSLDFLEINHSYQIGSKSKGYKLGARFKDSEWEKIDFEDALIRFAPELKKKPVYAATYNLMWKRANAYFSTFENMEEGPSKEICIRTRDLLNEIILLREDMGDVVEIGAKEKHKELLLKGDTDWSEKQIFDGYNTMLDMVENQDWRINRDAKSKRLYHNLVNLKKTFRPFLRFRGQKLVTIDLRASQPTLLAAFYKPGDTEREEYIRTLQNEDIYLYLANTAKPRLERHIAKDGFFVLLFGTRWNHKGEFWNAFSARFPQLASRIAEQKKPENGGYKSVSAILQKLESSIMIDTVLYNLLFKYNIDAFTCHDSVSVLESDVGVVENEINNAFIAAMGFTPVFKRE